MARSPLLWSPATRGFYLKDVSSAIPDDAVTVSSRHHARLMEANANGAEIRLCLKTGRPIAVMPPPADMRSRIARMVRAEAGRRIDAVSPLWRQCNDMREPGPAASARFAAIDAIRTASNAIEAILADVGDADLPTFPVAENPLWPTFEETD